MNPKRVLGVLAVLGPLAVLATACGSSDSSSSTSGTSASSTTGLTAQQLDAIPPIVRLACSKDSSLKDKTIGVSWSVQASFVDQMNNDMEEFAKRSNCGVKFKFTNANGDAAKQLTQAQGLLAQKVDLLFQQPSTPQGWQTVIKQAKDANIPVYNWSSVATTGADVNVNVSQAQTGAVVAPPAADWIKNKQGGKADVAIMVSPTDVGFKARAQAFTDKLKELAPGANIVATAPGGYANPAEAEKTALTLIQANPNLKMIFGDWDAATLGAAQAAKDSNKTDPDQFFIAGTDGSDAQLSIMEKPGNVIGATGALLFRYDAGINVNNMLHMLMGDKVPPTRVLVPRVVLPDGVSEFKKLAAEPFAPQNAGEYKNITLYYSTPETTEKPIPSGPTVPAP